MTVFAVQALLGFRNAARRDAVMSNVQTRLAQSAPNGVVRMYAVPLDKTGDPGFYCEVRFNTKLEQESFWSDLIAAFGSGLNGPVTGSRWWRHDCSHDQPSANACAVELEGAA